MDYERRSMVIWGRTYPETSKRHLETVCTGAVLLDGQARMIRIYPLADRYLPEGSKTSKWQVLSAEVRKSQSDTRPESYQIQPQSIRHERRIGTEDGWQERRDVFLRPEFMVGGIEELEAAQATSRRSFGIVKPVAIEEVTVKRASAQEMEERRQRYEEIYRQQELWVPGEAPVPPRTFDVRVRFRAPGDSKAYDRLVLDWEVYAIAQHVEHKAGPLEGNVRDALLKYFDLKRYNTHLVLGNMKSHPQEFVVVGIFYPPVPGPQVGLFQRA